MTGSDYRISSDSQHARDPHHLFQQVKLKPVQTFLLFSCVATQKRVKVWSGAPRLLQSSAYIWDFCRFQNFLTSLCPHSVTTMTLWAASCHTRQPRLCKTWNNSFQRAFSRNWRRFHTDMLNRTMKSQRFCQPWLCLSAPQSLFGTGTGYRALLQTGRQGQEETRRGWAQSWLLLGLMTYLIIFIASCQDVLMMRGIMRSNDLFWFISALFRVCLISAAFKGTCCKFCGTGAGSTVQVMDDHHLWSQGSSLLHQWNYVIISSTDSWGWCLWTFKHIQPTRIWLWLDEKPAALLPPRWWWVSLGFHSCRTQIKRDGGLLTFCELQPISLQLPQSDLISYCWRKKRSLNGRHEKDQHTLLYTMLTSCHYYRILMDQGLALTCLSMTGWALVLRKWIIWQEKDHYYLQGDGW